MSRPKLKICGVKSVTEAEQLASLEIDYIGLNFIPVSKRKLDLPTAEQIMRVLSQISGKTVALFADQPLELVNQHAKALRVDYVQLHGREDAVYAAAIDAPVMRAVAVQPEWSAGDVLSAIEAYPADYFVLDRHIQGQGALLDIDLVNEVIAAKPDKIFLAGGLTPHNLAIVLEKAKPFGIDIAGGVRENEELIISKVDQCLRLLRATD